MKFILDLVFYIIDGIKNLFFWSLDKFLGINIFEKLIFFTFIPAFFAVAFPVARYFIFDSYTYINNPLAIYMIGIVFLMPALSSAPSVWALAGRVIINAYYIFWVVYLHLSGSLSKAPYELIWGYYLNIIVPALFVLLSFLSYLIFRDD